MQYLIFVNDLWIQWCTLITLIYKNRSFGELIEVINLEFHCFCDRFCANGSSPWVRDEYFSCGYGVQVAVWGYGHSWGVRGMLWFWCGVARCGVGGAISVFRDNFPSAGENFILLDGLGGRQWFYELFNKSIIILRFSFLPIFFSWDLSRSAISVAFSRHQLTSNNPASFHLWWRKICSTNKKSQKIMNMIVEVSQFWRHAQKWNEPIRKQQILPNFFGDHHGLNFFQWNAESWSA